MAPRAVVQAARVGARKFIREQLLEWHLVRGSVRGASEDALRIVVRAIVSNATEGQRVDMAAGILPGYVTTDYVLERMGFNAHAEPLAEVPREAAPASPLELPLGSEAADGVERVEEAADGVAPMDTPGVAGAADGAAPMGRPPQQK